MYSRSRIDGGLSFSHLWGALEAVKQAPLPANDSAGGLTSCNIIVRVCLASEDVEARSASNRAVCLRGGAFSGRVPFPTPCGLRPRRIDSPMLSSTQQSRFARGPRPLGSLSVDDLVRRLRRCIVVMESATERRQPNSSCRPDALPSRRMLAREVEFVMNSGGSDGVGARTMVWSI